MQKNKTISISYFQLRTIIGLLGIFLPLICIAGTIWFNNFLVLDSISLYYYTSIRDIFVGIMICISIFLFSYHGYNTFDNVITNISGVAGVLIALFPCKNLAWTDKVSVLVLDNIVTDKIHLVAALVFFSLLAINSIFCFTKSDTLIRKRSKKYYRNVLYRTSGVIILVCLAVLIFITCFTSDAFRQTTRLTLVLESVMLLAFGISWLVKGGTLLRDRNETSGIRISSDRMAKKSESIILFTVGLVSCIGFLRLEGTIPLPLEIVLKIMPTLMMCVWMLINRIDKTNWPIFAGLIFAFIGDISMSLPGEIFVPIGIGFNMLALIFFIVYFIRSDPSLDLLRVIPFTLIMGILYAVLYNHLGGNKIPVLVYCVLYIVFLWRASARLGDKDISIRSQLICFFGSLIIATSDSLLSMKMFGVMTKTILLDIVIMCMWWTGLLLLMVTAELKKRKHRMLHGDK